jgi:hypothetical protein
MTGQKIINQAAEMGFILSLSGDWKRVRCEGSECPPEALTAKVKAHKPEILFWLKAETLRDCLSGSILISYDAQDECEAEPYPYAHPQKCNQERWLASAEAILVQRNSEGRLDATFSEIDSCIIGVRSFSDPASMSMHKRLTAAIPEARKCSQRLKSRTKRQIEKKNREWEARIKR